MANLANNACDQLYCFKFSQTLYSSTVPIKKNGMHFVDNTNAPYNIGGITKAGEVWRLFARGAAPNRDRISVIKGAGTSGLDVVATRDLAEYEAFTREAFMNNRNVVSFTTYVVMDAVKSGSALPL